MTASVCTGFLEKGGICGPKAIPVLTGYVSKRLPVLTGLSVCAYYAAGRDRLVGTY